MARATSSPQSVAELPFLLFVGVSDADRTVGAAEADAFFRLLGDASWPRCRALGNALPDASRRYADDWRRYMAGEIDTAPAAVLQRIAAVSAGWAADEVTALEADLLHIGAVLRSAARKPRVPADAPSPRAPMAALGAVLRAVAPAATGVDATAPKAATTPRAVTAEAPPSQPLGAADPWQSVRTRLSCVGVADETPDVRTFSFVAEPARPFSFKPGQFMTLDLEVDGRRVRRTYTISSSPSRPLVASITVKRVPGGRVSNWLHEHLAVGHVIQAVVANGKFNAWDVPAEKALLLSAGVGITPLMSMVRWHVDTCADIDIVFAHSARSPEDIMFRRELAAMEGPRFRVIVNCTRPHPDDAWTGLTGRFDAEMLGVAVPDVRDRVVFMCGPQGFMRTMRALLLAAGCPPDRIHQESFGPRGIVEAREGGAGQLVTAVTDAAEASTPTSPAASRIVFSRSQREVACQDGEMILDVAERSGIEIASSCRVGACGTCRVRKTAGLVRSEHCPGLAEADAAEGYVLTCSSMAEGTVVLDA